MKTIKDAGHLSNLEKPEEFNKYLEEFLASIKQEVGSGSSQIVELLNC